MQIPGLNRIGRLLAGLLGPSIVAAFILLVFVLISTGINEGPSLEMFQSVVKGFVIFLVAGSIFIGLQSLVYTLVMEFIVRPKFRLRNTYLVVSCMLGAVSGSIVDIIFDDLPFFTILGAITGLLMGLILYNTDMQNSHTKSMQSDTVEPHR